MNAVTKIMNELEVVFAPMDAAVLENTKAWAEGRIAACAEWRETEEAKELRREHGVNAFCAVLHRICGGSTWYNGLTDTGVAFVEKNAIATAKKRNAAIAKKLDAAGVTEVLETTFTHTNDGFDGVFVVMTDAGRKVVTVNTVYAGGYNVQCLHLRVLTKVK